MEVGWLTLCDIVNKYVVSAATLYNQKFLRCSLETVNIVYHKSDPCSLDLWPSELKNIRNCVLHKTNQCVKHKSSVRNSSQDNENITTFLVFLQL